MNQVVAQIKSLARKKNKIRLVYRQVAAQFMLSVVNFLRCIYASRREANFRI